MIPFEFSYYKPSTIDEALSIFKDLKQQKKQIMYYGGGTEIITLSRAFEISPNAIIDIKGIPECNVYEIKDQTLIIGAANTLTNVAEKNFFPLLSETIRRIADHTIQDKITIGGNILGTIIYKESILPLLLTDSILMIASFEGIKYLPISSVFNKSIKLNEGDLLVQIHINTKYLSLPYVHVKRTKNEKISYPLITLVALKENDKLTFAFSGLLKYPYHSKAIDNLINDYHNIYDITSNLPDKILDDLHGSSQYREFILDKLLVQALQNLNGGKNVSITS